MRSGTGPTGAPSRRTRRRTGATLDGEGLSALARTDEPVALEVAFAREVDN
jgi:hypothetical protein